MLSSRFSRLSTLLCSMSWFSSQLALSAAMPPPPSLPGNGDAAVTSAVPTAETPSGNANFISDGSPYTMTALGMTITPPKGWEVAPNAGTMAMVMQEPKDPNPDYEHAKFQRNITVAAVSHPSPIDENRAKELEADLTKQAKADGAASEFQIVEHKFFNYKGANDGLVVYSRLNIGEFPVMQMHVLVSGQDRQFLLSYSDLSERFTAAKDPGFETAWNSMVSIQVLGNAPALGYGYMVYAGGGLALFVLGLAAFALLRRFKKVDYATEADNMIEDDACVSNSPSLLATLAGGWRVESQAAAEISGMTFTSAHAPITRSSRYATSC